MNMRFKALLKDTSKKIEANSFMFNVFRKVFLALTLFFIAKASLSFAIFKDMSLTCDVGGDALPDEATMLYGFIQQEGKRIGEKYNMSLCAVGGGVDHLENKINLMSPGFQRIGPELTEGEARKLIIQCLDDYLSAVNGDEKLRPF